MIAARVLRRLQRDARGVTAVEFAVVSGPLFLIMFGIRDMGRQAYASSVVQGTLVQAARKAGLEGANQATIKTFVDGQLSQFALPGNIQMTITSFKQFSGVGNPVCPRSAPTTLAIAISMRTTTAFTTPRREPTAPAPPRTRCG